MSSANKDGFTSFPTSTHFVSYSCFTALDRTSSTKWAKVVEVGLLSLSGLRNLMVFHH